MRNLSKRRPRVKVLVVMTKRRRKRTKKIKRIRRKRKTRRRKKIRIRRVMKSLLVKNRSTRSRRKLLEISLRTLIQMQS